MKILESAENYLECILKLSEQLPRVRAIDIVNELGLSKPSVSVAMKNLKNNGYIIINDNSSIELTKKGFEVAHKILTREKIITKVLTSIGVSQNQAQIDACKIEHIISDESINCINKYLEENNK